MKEWNILENGMIKLLGRFDRDAGHFYMDWTGSGIEFIVQGAHAEVQMTAVNDGKEQWVLFELDGQPSSRIRLLDGTHWYTLLDSRGHADDRTLIPAARRRLRIYKESQANYSELNSTTTCDRIRTDGELCAPPVRKKIEFIGDSLTSGEGTVSPRFTDIGSSVSIDEWSSTYYGWTGCTSRLLDADYQVVSQGGWGVYCGWDNNRITNIPSIYDRICGIILPPWAAARGADKPYDFSFHPDVIVVNLGTNDDSAFHQPPWKHPVTGELFKQHQIDEETNPDSDEYIESDKEKVVQSIVDFVRLLVEKNPQTPIFWAYGMMRHTLWPTIEKAKGILHELGITQFETILLPDASGAELGSNNHPLSVSHEICAKVVADRIRSIL